jgi:hypothetical protein
MKLCKKCYIEKNENEFCKCKRMIDGLYCYCKACESINKKEYYQQNKAKLIVNAQNNYRKNKDRKKAYDKKRYQKNIEKHQESSRLYYQKNKRIYADRNRKNSAEKYKNNPVFKIRNRVSCEIKRALKKNNSSKNGHSVLDFIPYSIRDLKVYLENQFEPWMTWNNWGKYDPKIWNDNDQSTWTWQIDHIIPQSKLPYTTMTDNNFQICWALSNLRPLSAKQNLLDGVYRKRHINE